MEREPGGTWAPVLTDAPADEVGGDRDLLFPLRPEEVDHVAHLEPFHQAESHCAVGEPRRISRLRASAGGAVPADAAHQHLRQHLTMVMKLLRASEGGRRLKRLA